MGGFHDAAHLGLAGGAGLGDGFLDEGLEFFGRELGGEQGLEEFEFLLLLGGELGAVAVGEALDGVFPLLGFLADDGDDLDVAGDGIGAAFFVGGVLLGGLEHAQDGEFVGVTGDHGGFQVGINFCNEAHRGSSIRPGRIFDRKT